MFYVLLNYEYVDFTFSYFSFCLCGYIEQIQQSFLFLQHPNLTIFIFISAGRKICFVIKTPCSGESEVRVVRLWTGRRSGRYYHIEEKNGVPATTQSQSPPRDRQQQIVGIKQLCNIWSRISPALQCQLMSTDKSFFCWFSYISSSLSEVR